MTRPRVEEFEVAAGVKQASMFVSPAAPILVVGILFALFSAIRFAIEKRHAYVWFKRLENSRQVAMESMAAVAETRDPETGAHIKRTQHYVRAIAEQLKSSGKYANILTPEYIHLLFISAPLHDIGKVGPEVPHHCDFAQREVVLHEAQRLFDERIDGTRVHPEFPR